MQQTAVAERRRPIRDWVVAHDESRLFTVLYIGLALVLSIAIGLFWLLALVAVHFAFEFVRFRHHGEPPPHALRSAAWELKLDLSLVLFAVALTLYLHFVLGVLGIQAASRAGAVARAGLKGGSRVAALENVIRGILLSVDDAVYALRAFFAFRRRPAADAPDVAPTTPAAATPPSARWSRGDRLSVALGGLSLILIAASPWVSHPDAASVLATLRHELHPFPAR